jgi:hypothetical protein
MSTIRKLGEQLAHSALANTLCDLTRSGLESHFADAGYSDPADASDQALLVALEEIDSWPTIPSGRRLARERLSGLFVADPKPCPFCGANTACSEHIGNSYEIQCGSCQAYAWGETYEEAVATWNRRTSVQVGADAEQRFRLARVLKGILNG